MRAKKVDKRRVQRVLCVLSGLLLAGCADGPSEAREAVPASPAEPEGAEPATPEVEPAADPAPVVEGPPTVVISAVGDCTIGGQWAARRAPGSFQHEMKERGDYAYPFSGVLSTLEEDDLTIANLETTLTDEPAIDDGAIRFQGKPEYVEILQKGSVELVNLANNHTGDCGTKGFEETMRTLEEAEVGYFGEGHVDRRTIKGIEVVNLGYRGGSLSVQKQVEREVQAHKRDDNLVIVSFHWGIEEYTATNTVQLRLGRTAVDAGADLVLGHHPHRLQGLQTRKNSRIVYSLGNFVFGGHSQPEDYDSMIYRAKFTMEDGKVVPAGEELIPVSISSSAPTRNDFRPVLLEGEDKARVLENLAKYSKALEG